MNKGKKPVKIALVQLKRKKHSFTKPTRWFQSTCAAKAKEKAESVCKIDSVRSW